MGLVGPRQIGLNEADREPRSGVVCDALLEIHASDLHQSTDDEEQGHENQHENGGTQLIHAAQKLSHITDQGKIDGSARIGDHRQQDEDQQSADHFE